MKDQKFRLPRNSVEEVKELAVYLKGYAAGTGDEKLEDAAEWMDKLSDHVCAGGYIGCDGGITCTSDHK
jgi:hypothetical protein